MGSLSLVSGVRQPVMNDNSGVSYTSSITAPTESSTITIDNCTMDAMRATKAINTTVFVV